MAKLALGILGGFSGAVGTVVGSVNKKGDDIIRARSKRSRPANTAGQVKQQTKFGLVNGTLQGLNPVIKIGLKQIAGAKNMTPFNYASAYALSNALTGTDEQPELDYTKLLLSQGGLNRISGASATKTAEGVQFVWSDKVEGLIGELTDYVTLVVYNADNSELCFSAGQYLRKDKKGLLPLPYSESGDRLYCYLFFQSATDALLVSNTQHAGSLIAE